MDSPTQSIVGWELFRDSDFELARSEINEELEARGLPPVSNRMYQHYRKLARHGVDRYMPINQLDVETSSAMSWDRDVRTRYPLLPADEPVRVTVLRGDRVFVLDGDAERLSDAEGLLRLPGSAA